MPFSTSATVLTGRNCSQDLRERRNALRRSLPQLIAEQSVTHTHSVRWPRTASSTAAPSSSSRDLSALLQHQDKLPPALSAAIQELQCLGSERLKTLGQDVAMQTSAHNDAWSRLRLALNEAVDAALLESDGSLPLADNPDHQQRRFLASRLLLLMPWTRSPVPRCITA